MSEVYTGTRPVSDKHAFDVATLEAYLRQHLPGFSGPLNVEMFKGGQSNPTYKLLTPGQTYPMDIFHAERHTNESNFRIVTTIECFITPPPPG